MRDKSGAECRVTIGSPGVLSGNVVRIPIDIPVNACGNSVDVVALPDPAFGNTCANVDAGRVSAPTGGQEMGGSGMGVMGMGEHVVQEMTHKHCE